MTLDGNCRKLLEEQLCRILEETAYMLVENPQAPMPSAGIVIEAGLSFSGRETGICWLVVPEADAHQLAAEMLGQCDGEPPTAEVAGNAVSELLNILTAWVLEEWWGGDFPHALGIPATQCKQLNETLFFAAPAGNRVVVATDSGCVFMSCITTE